MSVSIPLLSDLNLDISSSLDTAINQLSQQISQSLCRVELLTSPQKIISFHIDSNNKLRLEELLSESRERARLGALGLPHAGDFLFAVPSPTLGLHMRGEEFRLAVCYRLGIKVYEAIAPCPACHRESDRFGDHVISCGTVGECIAYHNHLRDALYSTAVCAALRPLREERAFLPGNDRKPADIFLPN